MVVSNRERTELEMKVGRCTQLMNKWAEEKKIEIKLFDDNHGPVSYRVVVGDQYIYGSMGEELVARVALALEYGEK